MIRHVVLIKFKSGAPKSIGRQVKEALEALPRQIPEIRSLEVGEDVVRGPNSADLGLVVGVDDLAALDRYRVHLDHRRIVEELIAPNLERIVAVDFKG